MAAKLPHFSLAADSTSFSKTTRIFKPRPRGSGVFYWCNSVAEMSENRFRSASKINLFLNVTEKREDGFHELESIFVKVPLFDELVFEEGKGSGGIDFRCSDARIPSDGSNLVVKAANAYYSATGKSPNIRISLEKHLPSEAGMGGGSGNAATTLLALNRLHDGALDDESMHRIASELGSDVPFFLMGDIALGTGRGEILEDAGDIPAISKSHLVVAKPDFGVPTGWAFRSLSESNQLGVCPTGSALHLIEQLGHEPSRRPDRSAFFNSFEKPVFEKFPYLAWIRDVMVGSGSWVSLLSGSGSAVFGLFDDEASANKCMVKLQNEKDSSLWCQQTYMGHETGIEI